MPKFRKRPIVITAELFQPTQRPWPNGVYAVQDVERMVDFGGVYAGTRRGRITYHIKTLEGVMDVRPGDWIVTGIKGEKYNCAADIFEATYEPVNDNDKCSDCGGSGILDCNSCPCQTPCTKCKGAGKATT